MEVRRLRNLEDDSIIALWLPGHVDGDDLKKAVQAEELDLSKEEANLLLKSEPVQDWWRWIPSSTGTARQLRARPGSRGAFRVTYWGETR